MAEGTWKNVAASFAARIESGELTPGTRLPSGDELARTLGINRNSAHRAIEELQRQGLVVRRQGSGTVVAERAERKGYRVALLVDGYSTFHNFPSGDLLHGVQERIGDESTLIIADSKHDSLLEGRQLKRLARETDGIMLYVSSPERNAVLGSLVADGFPAVALDRLPHDVRMDGVVTDNRGAAHSAVQMLLDRGHRRIGFLGFNKLAFSSVRERFQGYEDAMASAGIDTTGLIRWLPEGVDQHPDIYRQIMRDTLISLRHGEDAATAVFCVEDLLGTLAVATCEQLGINLPDDFELASFNDWHPMTLKTPWNVHRLVQNKFEIGHSAANLLLDRIVTPGQPHKVVQVAADLIIADAGLQSSFAPMSSLSLASDQRRSVPYEESIHPY